MKIKDKNNDFVLIMGSALRYGLGRRTYITSVIPEFIIQNMDLILDGQKEVMIKDIKDQEKWRWIW